MCVCVCVEHTAVVQGSFMGACVEEGRESGVGLRLEGVCFSWRARVCREIGGGVCFSWRARVVVFGLRLEVRIRE